jgi:hypothetical protein
MSHTRLVAQSINRLVRDWGPARTEGSKAKEAGRGSRRGGRRGRSQCLSRQVREHFARRAALLAREFFCSLEHFWVYIEGRAHDYLI